MAPKKKGKKATSKPLRGYATTSVPSKNTAESAKNEEALDSTTTPELFKESKNPNVATIDRTIGSKELHELDPAELEKQLEESDLQLLLEKHGQKSKKDASRQISRLQTERRLLRPQSELLGVRSWLSPDLLQTIIDLYETNQSSPNGFEKLQTSMQLQEDDLCIKLWTLRQVLSQIGFSSEQCQEALCHAMKVVRQSQASDISADKDTIWGLEVCLEWLSFKYQSNEMPPYEAELAPGLAKKSLNRQQADFDRLYASSGSVLETPAISRRSSPSPSPKPELMPPSHPSVLSRDLQTPNASASDSELDPEEMTDKFLSLKSRLHDIDPVLANTEPRRSKDAHHQALIWESYKSNRVVTRLFQRLERLKADILFDIHEAEIQWAAMRTRLVKEAFERRRLQLPDAHSAGLTSPDLSENRDEDSSEPTLDGEASEEDDAITAVGDLFSGLPAEIPGTSKNDTAMVSQSSNGAILRIRDFGKWAGINPRRIFEEACKARDSSFSTTFKLHDRSPFSKQHSLELNWSRNQSLPVHLPTDAFLSEADQRSVRIQMKSEAASDAIQSEAYISTVALFLVFSTVPKEEKASLRLPPVWRDFWAELATLKKNMEEEIDRGTLRELRNLIYENPEHLAVALQPAHDDPPSSQKLSVDAQNEKISAGGDLVRATWLSKSSTAAFQGMMHSRRKLPIWSFKRNLIDAVDQNQIVIVCGETGCGKSTQVPSFLLEHELSNGRSCRIYCTEPRRISAISLARRVSEELGEKRNDVGTSRSLVGYAIRLESKLTPDTKVVYATTGVVMRMLEGSNDLREITHLILDEVHERSIDSDFLLIVLRKLLLRRPNLKVVLMSATVNASKFSNYFGGVPILDVPGRTFPVETKYLEDALEATDFTVHDKKAGTASIEEFDEDDTFESQQRGADISSGLDKYRPETRSALSKLNEYQLNYNLIVKLLQRVATDKRYSEYSKAVLVFLPGIAEIRRLNDMLAGHDTFSKGWRIHPLHSTIALEEQERAFDIPQNGMRKIVLSTNIAETGVTIPDVTCVIDSGKHREMRFDERRQLSRLIEVFISRANAKQRRGRAGRVQNGLCFHLFTKARHDNLMAEEQTPEILRLSLQDLVLRVKIYKLGDIEQTLSEALDPPLPKNIRRAIDALIDVKALTTIEDLTPLGRQLAKLPLDVFLGKLVLLGSIFKCLDGAITIAAIISSKSPFSAPMGARSQADQARLGFKKGDSDLLSVYDAYCAWRRVCNASGGSEQQFCRKNFLLPQNLSNIEDLKGQLTTTLVDAGFLELGDSEKAALNRARSWSWKRQFVEIPERYNMNATDLILNSVIAWSFYPKLLRRDGKGWRNVGNNQAVSIHPTSVNKGGENVPRWLSFYHIMQSSNKFYNAHETSAVEEFAIAIACGDADFKMYSGVIVIDGSRIRFCLDDWRMMLAVKALRSQIRQIMVQSFRKPGRQLSPHQQQWLDVWQKIFLQKSDEKL